MASGRVALSEIDRDALPAPMQAMAPEAGRSVSWPEDLGSLSMQAQMQDGKLTTRTRFNIDDLGKMGAAFTALAAQSTGTAVGGPATAPKPPPAPAAADRKKPEERPGYWYERGGLQSAYGAYEAAVRSYRKAIELAPRYADAYFQLGVAHGELHQFEAALKAMSKAIDLDAENSAYYYGRGRVYLLAGEDEQAMRDFMEAGFLGNTDALAYLKDQGVSLE